MTESPSAPRRHGLPGARNGAGGAAHHPAAERSTGRPWATAGILATVLIACYALSLGNDFVWDDRLTAVAPASFWKILTRRTGDYYRPVVMLSFAFDRMLWGEEAFGFHLTNLVFHFAGAFLLARLATAVGFRPGLALAAALTFAAHPVQTEAVSYISGRTDVLCGMFTLMGLLAWRGARTVADARALAAGACFLLALLCKEAVVAVPFLLLLREAHPGESPPRPVVPIGVAIAWILCWTATGGPGVLVAGMWNRLPAVMIASVTYARLLLWPADLHLERFVPICGWSAQALASAAALLLAAAVSLWRGRRMPGGLLWLALAASTFLPVSGLVPVYPEIAGQALFTPEHFLYLPLLGLAPFVVSVAEALLSRYAPRRVPALALAFALVVWAPLVMNRNRDWSDEERLFRHTLRYRPPVARVWFNLGNLRLAAGDLAEATSLFETAVALAPHDTPAHLNLAIAYQRAGRLTDAESLYRGAIRLDPKNAAAYRGLAAVLLRRGDRDRARRILRQARRLGAARLRLDEHAPPLQPERE